MHYLINVTAYVTVYTLVLISVIRFMTIVHPSRTARYRTINPCAFSKIFLNPARKRSSSKSLSRKGESRPGCYRLIARYRTIYRVN